MNAHIQVLPSTLIDQIAAGEVVERPASVVKELAENALDAGAGRIEVRIQAGGAGGIRITDDGAGMGRADLALAIVRHATSKLRSLADLQRIRTLGFRGEALPSIAAVSRLRITTRQRGEQVGSRLTLDGGGQAVIVDAGAASGTDVEVTDLFFNTPARRKFLRTPTTEMGHISAWMAHLALARPDVAIRVEHNGRLVLEAPATADLAQRVAAVLGREPFEHLHPIGQELDGIAVSGLISDPGYSRNNTKGIHVFINGRFVRDRLLQYAIMEGYRTVLPDRRFPLVVIRIDLDPELVDVNVHPQKTEVRFSDARTVQRALAAAISGTLAATPWMNLGQEQGPVRTYTLAPGPAAVDSGAAARAERVREALGRYGSRQGGLALPGRLAPAVVSGPALNPPRGGSRREPEFVQERPLYEWQLVGVLWNTYLMLTDAERLALVDQHAAHERITFERLREAVAGNNIQAQRMLVPVQVELDEVACALVEEEPERLRSLGFDLEPFGPKVVSVRSVPALLAQAAVGALVRDLLDEMSETREAGAWEERRLDLLSRMACHASVRAGQQLSEQEVRSLLRQLSEIDFAGQCPHGRPIMVQFARSEVAHWFLRS